MAKARRDPRRFVGTYTPHEPGEYLAQLDPRGGRILDRAVWCFPAMRELVTAADPEMMHQIAEAGEKCDPGTMWPVQAEGCEIGDPIPGEPEDAWDRVPTVLILVIFSLEWILRRRWSVMGVWGSGWVGWDGHCSGC